MLTTSPSEAAASAPGRDLASRLSPTLRAAMQRVRAGAEQAAAPAMVVAVDTPTLPGRRLATPTGAVHVHRTAVDVGDWHGGVAIDVDRSLVPEVAAAASRDLRLAASDPRGWLYIDTETTSLHAGAGVWVFLLGMGWFEGDRFVVEQTLLCGPESEEAWFDVWAQRVREASALVSFHGRCFDAPRIDDRLRLAGRAPLCLGRPHFDLLYPTRRLAAGTWPDCRLRTAEQRLLGFERHGDLPGALCPAAWFAWLRDQPNRLAEVFEHNRLDVVSLAALTGELTRQYSGQSAGRGALATGLDWWRAGRPERALADWRRAAETDCGLQGPATLFATRALRRLGERDLSAHLAALAGLPAVAAGRVGLRAERMDAPRVSPAASRLAPKSILAQTLSNLRTGRDVSCLALGSTGVSEL